MERSQAVGHGPEQTEGSIRIDTLDPNLHTGKDVDWWTEVFAVISKGEMPPPENNDLSEEDRQKIVEWLSTELQAASIARRQSARHSAFRRLTRYEYNYAMQDLLGLPWDFAKDLPPDAQSDESFQNSSDLLHMSVAQFETHHRLARAALTRIVTTGPQPKSVYWGVTMKDASRLEWPKQEKKLAEVRKAHKDDPEKLAAELKRLEESFHNERRRSYYRELATGKTAEATWDYGGAKHAIASSEKPVDIRRRSNMWPSCRQVNG